MPQEVYYFPWQNPTLRNSIYPHRDAKLRDFLLVYKEADLWAQLRSKDITDPQTDPVVKARLAELEAKGRQERERVTRALQAGIDARLQSDQWFSRILGTGTGEAKEKNLRFKRLYYLDRMITEYSRRFADLDSRKASLIRRVDWYPEGDSRRQTWEGRAKELDAPIEAVKQELDSLTQLRELFDREARLPKADRTKPLTLADFARAELSDYQRELDQMHHDQLVEAAWQRLNEKLPSGNPRFEKWFAYMIIHFSGMRYKSAHGSWADPDDLLELLVREDQKGKIQPGEDIDDRVEAEIQRLLKLPADAATRHLDANLRALVYFKQQKERQGEPIPDWVWDEIQKYTQLRLGVTEENWESSSPERWKFENRRWREIMSNWQRADITGWRSAHRQTLDLIVTRAVCNEIAEHIQHLRGNLPPGGLTSKPKWYLSLQKQTQNLPEDNRQKCYFRHAQKPDDFNNGASVFWLGWVDREPNAWQVAGELPGVDLWPGVKLAGSKPSAAAGSGWSYSKSGAAFIRTQKITIQIPSVRDLRKRGMTDREIDAYRAELRKQNTLDKEYLRWKHEAIAVEVVELIDGPHVLTFETGKIGLNWHHIGSLVNNAYDQVFVGYLPKAEKEPENLPRMLDNDKILHRPVQPPSIQPVPGEITTRDLLAPEPAPPAQPATSSITLLAGAFPSVPTSMVTAESPAVPVLKFYIYFITNRSKKNIFSGVTSDIKVRVEEHKHGILPGFPDRVPYNHLVHYQAYECLEDALAISALFDTFTDGEIADFISANNPGWRDLASEL